MREELLHLAIARAVGYLTRYSSVLDSPSVSNSTTLEMRSHLAIDPVLHDR